MRANSVFLHSARASHVWVLAAGFGLISTIGALAQSAPARAATQSPTAATQTLGPLASSLSVEDRADIFMARRDYSAALQVLGEAERTDHASPAIYNRMGIANEYMLNLPAATKYFKLANKGAPKQAQYINNLGTVYFEQKKYGSAEKQFAQAIKLDATVPAYFINLGSARFAQKKYRSSLDAYRAALQLDPNALYPNSSSGAVLQDVNTSDQPRYHYDLARLMCSMGMVDEAMHQFRQALEQHYAKINDSLTDPVFAPLRTRPDYQSLMGMTPAVGGY